SLSLPPPRSLLFPYTTLFRSQRMEHSLEVQLPFLQHIYDGRFSLLPICLAFQDIETARELGRGLAALLRGKNAVLIASSDLTHRSEETRLNSSHQIISYAVFC